ncbi:FxsA family protein [PVC group bacterium]|nr:FxsA family protein [PVC group bacterium]
MFFYLILLFTLVPVGELVLLLRVGEHIGVGNTVFLVIFTGIIGAALAKMQGLLTMQRIQDNLGRGVMPAEEMFDGAMILCGGVLLLTPGFVTDILGLSFLIPLTRNLYKKIIKKHIQKKFDHGDVITIHHRGP